MKNIIRFLFSIFFVFTLLFSNIPIVNGCGPSYLTPVFDYQRAPENPYKNYAGGKLGIVKHTYPRVVLFAAYRHLSGTAFSADEQQALVDVWEAYFNNKDFDDGEIKDVVKTWVEERKNVFPDEKETPQIYVERSYGGYDFFPNCSKNAFEVATQTLSDRRTRYGSDDRDVKNWVLAQDQVFNNCASGKSIPTSLNSEMSEWLQKDRKYQIAAAEFYSLNFNKAKGHFAEISEDSESPWQELSKYLVGRTLIRQASLTKNKNKTETIYTEAEQHLHEVAASGGKYANSAEKLLGLVKYRLRPEERVRELAQSLTYYGGDNFRQDLIDYTWLLDSFEAKALNEEEKRKEAQAPDSNTNVSNTEVNDDMSSNSNSLANNDDSDLETNDENILKIRFYNDDYSESWVIQVNVEATDAEAIAEAEKLLGQVTEKMKSNIIEARQSAYQSRFSDSVSNNYDGRYYGEEETNLEILPDFLRYDDLSDWLFTFQIQSNQAYLYSLLKFQQGNSALWLMTALSKANRDSEKISELLDSAQRIAISDPAFATISYHRARILIEQEKQNEARKLIDEILELSDVLPISARNQFLDLRLGLSETLDDFLKFSLKKPFTISQDDYSISIDEEIAKQKSYYDPKYDKKSRIEYEQEVEARFKNIKAIKDELMLDYDSVDIINQNFPTSLLLEIRKSKHLPDYLKDRLAHTIWTRAVLLEDFETADKILPDVIKNLDQFPELFNKYKEARTKTEKINASLFIVLKNENLSPYLSAGFGPPEDNYSGGSKWWCGLDDEQWDDTLNKLVPRANNKPKFLDDKQRIAAQAELKRLKTIGDASNYLTTRVLEWAKRSPRDSRIQESLYITYQANGWDKYGCGGNSERQKMVGNYLKRRYPSSSWTKMIIDEEK